MANKRIIEQAASTTISNDDWLIKDSPTDGTTKIQASVLKTLMNDGMASDEDLADAIENIAGEYDSEVEYSKDALCFKDGVLYIANADTTGTWDSTKWDATTIADIIANLRIDANDVVDVKVKGDSLVNSSKIAVLDSLTAQGSASGSIASFSDGSTHPMSKLEVGINPIQDLHGYDYPWAGGAGKNKLNYNNSIKATSRIEFNYGTTLKANTSYTFSYYGNDNVTILCYQHGTDTRIFSSGYTKTYTYTPTEDMFVDISFYRSPSLVIEENLFQLEEGNTSTSYAPYSNICPISGFTEANVNDVGKNRLNIDASESGGIDAQGEMAWGNNLWRTTEYIKVNSNETYTFSSLGCVLRIYYYDANKNFLLRVQGASQTEFTFTTPNNCKWIKWTIFSGDTTTVYTKAMVEALHLQIEKNNQATTYEHYNSQTYNVEFKDGSNPLTVYGGTLDVISGELTVTEVEIKMGTLNWTKRTDYGDGSWFLSQEISDKKIGSYNIMSSQYVVKQNRNYINATGQIAPANNTNSKDIVVRDDNYSDATTFKTAMSNVQLVYELATPITYQLTPTQVKSLLGSNNVWADTGDVNEAVYTRDLNTTVNDIISRIEALENA